MDLFPFIGPEHQFYSHIERLRMEVRTLMRGPLRFDARYDRAARLP